MKKRNTSMSPPDVWRTRTGPRLSPGRRLLLACLFFISIKNASCAAPVAGTPEEIVSRLQQAIDRASEQGNYQRVQTLRLELAQHYVSTSAYALAARQYELLLASRPSRKERVAFFHRARQDA